MFRKGLDFPNSFHSGWGQLLTKANFNPPYADFYVLKDIARYVLSYSKPLELLPVTSCQREKKKSSFSFFRAQPMFEGTSKTLP